MNCTCGKTAEFEMRSTQNPKYAYVVCRIHCDDSDFADGFSKSPISKEALKK